MSRSSHFSTRVLLLLLAFLIKVHGQQDVGDSCNVDGSAGRCSLLPQCQSVLNQLIAGVTPKKICGFKGYDPIVCCPQNTPTPSVVTPSTPTRLPETTESSEPIGTTVKTPIVDRSRGAVARTRCADYAQALNALVLPPTLAGGKERVNTSLCAIKSKTLVVGGEKAHPKEFPHMTAIGYNNGENSIIWSCGGSLISEKFVLTAAHCVFTEYGGAVRARVGDLNLVNPDDDALPQDLAIVERIKHPRYKWTSDYHDIGLLKLEKPVQFNAYVRPACLPYDTPEVRSTEKVLATGWGRVEWTDDEGSDDLLKVTISLVPHASCNASYSDGQSQDKLRLGIVNEWQLCAGEFGKDTCQGDSGGPISVFNKDHDCMYSVVGVTSIGRTCGNIIPGVYTRVAHYVQWIENIVWPTDLD